MEDVQFLKFERVNGEKHIGIATVRFNLKYKIIHRYKIQPKENSSEYFVGNASIKSNPYNGKDNYLSANQMDSQFEADELKMFILSNVYKHLNMTPPSSASVFNNNQSTQPEPPLYDVMPPENLPF